MKLSNPSFTETPFGQIPVLKIDGLELCQSVVCARYIAQKTGQGNLAELHFNYLYYLADKRLFMSENTFSISQKHI